MGAIFNGYAGLGAWNSTLPTVAHHQGIYFIHQDISRHIKTYQDISRHIKTYQDISRHIKTYQDISRHIKTYQDISSP